MTYPISEIFHSLQGEGAFTGTPMMFVRLAGCNVGEYISSHVDESCGQTRVLDFSSKGCLDPFPILLTHDLPLLTEQKHSVCTAVDGTRFLCDTDYHPYEKRTVEELVGMLEGERHVCVTGGEPFLHDLTPLVLAFQSLGVMVHVETSGTKPLVFPNTATDLPLINRKLLWITCAPKKGLIDGLLRDVDEVKILIGDVTDEDWLARFLHLCQVCPRGGVYLQPINGVNEERDASLQNCLRLLKKFPDLRLSAQLHKYIHQR